jgi:hypothetical protein
MMSCGGGGWNTAVVWRDVLEASLCAQRPIHEPLAIASIGSIPYDPYTFHSRNYQRDFMMSCGGGGWNRTNYQVVMSRLL